MPRLSAPEALRGQIGHDGSLAELVTLRVGGRAEIIISPSTEAGLAQSLTWLHSEDAGFYVIGGGSNVLPPDGVTEVPVILTTGLSGIQISRAGDSILVACGAGVELRKIFTLTMREGWSGLEFAAGIPGTVGGALMGNAGTRYGEIASAVRSVRVVKADGTAENLNKDEIEWGYRRSSLSESEPLVISRVELVFRESAREEVISSAKLAIASRSLQPAGVRTAGCVFKNPQGGRAGRLLDESGCKGLSAGGARVSPVHANFIENCAGASAMDIAKLAMECRRKVFDRFGILLQFEIRSFGFPEGFMKN
jgi:UDP-N-acetylmuramate dehydrogenase